ncbi:MAG: HDOD domain-containing protein, partial [Comamonas sp.]|nr:HDOD domain-containing protein [Comamonas sp.]
EIQLLGHAAAAEVKLRTPMLQSLRQRGFRLSFDHGVLDAVYADWLALADFIKLDLTTLTQEQWPALVQYTKTYSKAHLIATKVETAEQFETLSRLGVLLFQGYYFARPTVFEASLFIPHQASLVHLVGLLRSQASNDTLEETLKKDLGLAFNLLRLINSASFGLAHKVGSIKQAVALMGLKRLFRWAALLMAATKAAPAPTYEPNSLVRARQMELLAEDFLSPAQTEMAFVVGMFSTLQELIDTPFEEICELLHLPPPLRTALMQEGETLGTLLQVAKACEQSDEALFDSATEQLQLTDSQVNWAHLRALAWSDPITVG